MPTVRELLGGADLPGDSGRLEAEQLLCHCLQRARSYLYARPEQAVTGADCARYRALLAARRDGRPMAYITGSCEFWSLTLQVNEQVLIPRADTETLVQWALALDLPPQARVADWGTGSGAIALALASERGNWHITATDNSHAALALASANSRRLGLPNIRCVAADWDAPAVPGGYHLIVSNPPYVAADDPHWQSADLHFEPRAALCAAAGGLADLRRIVARAPARLAAAGWLLLEHGFEQGSAVRELLQGAGFGALSTHTDGGGRERVSGGSRHVE